MNAVTEFANRSLTDVTPGVQSPGDGEAAPYFAAQAITVTDHTAYIVVIMACHGVG
ncbi:hypothetical protein ACWEKM_09835 [Streptomyces sp. NPDC004752]